MPLSSARRLPTPFLWFLGITLALVGLSLGDAWQGGRGIVFPNRLGPLFLINPGFDFYDYLPRFAHRHSVSFFTLPGYPWYYPAPAIFLHYPFYKLAVGFAACPTPGQSYSLPSCLPITHAYVAYASVVLLLWLCFAVGLAISLQNSGLTRSLAWTFTLLTLLTSWPLYFALQRGNIEPLSWCILAAGLWAYTSGRRTASAVLLGFAGSIKLYPLLFLALFLKSGTRRPLFIALLTAALSSLCGLWFLEPHLADSLHHTAAAIHQWTVDYAVTSTTSMYDHSLFGLLKSFGPVSKRVYQRELKTYYVVMAPLIAGSYFARVRHLPLLNKVLFFSCAGVTLPPASFDYTLCMLYLPIAGFSLLATEANLRRRSTATLSLVMGLLAAASAPETFLHSAGLNLNGSVKALCLVTLLLLSVFIAFPSGQTRSSRP